MARSKYKGERHAQVMNMTWCRTIHGHLREIRICSLSDIKGSQQHTTSWHLVRMAHTEVYLRMVDRFPSRGHPWNDPGLSFQGQGLSFVHGNRYRVSPYDCADVLGWFQYITK
jgi:hypothetical protein